MLKISVVSCNRVSKTTADTSIQQRTYINTLHNNKKITDI